MVWVESRAPKAPLSFFERPQYFFGKRTPGDQASNWVAITTSSMDAFHLCEAILKAVYGINLRFYDVNYDLAVPS